jgi:hypothetical protein
LRRTTSVELKIGVIDSDEFFGLAFGEEIQRRTEVSLKPIEITIPGEISRWPRFGDGFGYLDFRLLSEVGDVTDNGDNGSLRQANFRRIMIFMIDLMRAMMERYRDVEIRQAI